MKTNKKILKGFKITPKTKHHNYEYLYRSMLKAMEEASKEASEYGRLLIDNPYYDPNPDLFEGTCRQVEIRKYEEFEDYLKNLKK